MHQIAYISSATANIGKSDIEDILTTAKRENARRGVTGILLATNEAFFQVLEGQQGDVEETFQNISRDKRHTGVIILLSNKIQERDFPDWSMGYHATDPNEGPGQLLFSLTKDNLDAHIRGQRAGVLLSLAKIFHDINAPTHLADIC